MPALGRAKDCIAIPIATARNPINGTGLSGRDVHCRFLRSFLAADPGCRASEEPVSAIGGIYRAAVPESRILSILAPSSSPAAEEALRARTDRGQALDIGFASNGPLPRSPEQAAPARLSRFWRVAPHERATVAGGVRAPWLSKRGSLKGFDSDVMAIALVSSAALHRDGKVVNSDPLDRGLLIEHRRCFS